MAEGAPRTVLCYGDSLTWGYDPEGPSRHRLEDRWPSVLQAALGRGAHVVAEGLNGRTVTMIRQAGETGQLYGSVAARDIVEALAADGFIVQRNQVDLAEAIKSVGVHTVALALHPEVAVSITVNVARSPDEAERQAAGEDVTVHTFEADEAGDFAAGQADAANDDRFEE